jgi:hypothetical protein
MASFSCGNNGFSRPPECEIELQEPTGIQLPRGLSMTKLRHLERPFQGDFSTPINIVGVGEGVARRGGGSAQAAEPRAMVAEGIADVVEARRVGELRKEQGDDVAPRQEGAGLFVDAVLFGEAGGEVGRDQLAKLGEDGQLCSGWFTIYHQADPEWDRPPVTLRKSRAMGWL